MKSTITKDGTGQRRGWTAQEIRQVAFLYYRMRLIQDNPSEFGKLKKAPMVRDLAEDLERSRGSIECKLMNVSHCVQLLGLGGLVKGYKPLPNIQKGMDAVVEQLFRDMDYKDTMDDDIECCA